jgi:eukaryotic-like serine/threonine-protein kinase
LEVVAVAGHPLRQIDALTAADLGDEGGESLTALRTAHLIRTTGGRPGDAIETYHDRVREAVARHIPRESLLQHHRRLAHALEASDEPEPAIVAAHFAGAEDFQRAAGYYALAAAEAAEALAFDRAANLYASAIDFSPASGDQLRDLRGKLADALADAGRGPEAAREYLTAAEGADAAEALEMRRRAAMQFLISGQIDDGLAVMRTVLAAVGMRLPRSPRLALWSLTLRRLFIGVRGLRFHVRDSGQISARNWMFTRSSPTRNSSMQRPAITACHRTVPHATFGPTAGPSVPNHFGTDP